MMTALGISVAVASPHKAVDKKDVTARCYT